MIEHSTRRRLGAALAAAAALGAAACERHLVTSSLPEDYRQRHPIMLQRGAETLEVFTGRNAGALDQRQAEDVRAFARLYMQHGEGPLVAYVPAGGDARGVHAGLAAIRSALGAGGAAGRLHIAHYQPDPGLAAPIRLSFARLTATTPSACGYDGDHLIPDSLRRHNLNAPPMNFGCAYQRNLAAQVADPRDFVRPRQEGPIDVDRRTSGIERIRENEAQELKPGGKSLKTLVGE